MTGTRVTGGDHLDQDLSAYLDDELGAAGRARADAHLAACAGCRDALAGLRDVVATARSLEDRGPATDLWRGIERRIAPPPPLPFVLPPRAARRPPGRLRVVRQFSFTLPQLASAAAIVAVLSGGGVWWAMSGARNAGVAATAPDGAGAAGGMGATAAEFEVRRYDAAAADLERVLDQNRGRLDPETVRTVEANLAAIDAAIASARRALAADPANPYLSGHLAEQMQRKIRVLQRAADAVTADYTGAS